MERVGDIHGMAGAYNNLGLVYAEKGEWDRAIQFYENGLETMERVGDIHGMAQTFGNLGNLYHDQGDIEQAALHVARAYLIFAQLGATSEAQQAHSLLGEILGSSDAANAYLTQLQAEFQSPDP